MPKRGLLDEVEDITARRKAAKDDPEEVPRDREEAKQAKPKPDAELDLDFW